MLLTCDQLLAEFYLKEKISINDGTFSEECVISLLDEGLISMNGQHYTITRLGKIAYSMGGIEEYYRYFDSEKPNKMDKIILSLTKSSLSFRSIFYSILGLYLFLIALIILYFWSFF